ncbi:MAG: hypothetical protein IJU29_00540 [Oscillospiraceae bacterium]|nr:hypothetical protein [Oscillospiraceae bacterium]
MIFDSYLNTQCNTLADTFVLAGKENWSSEDFANKLFHSKWGINILKGVSIFEYACPRYMYEGLKDNLNWKYGRVYDSDILRYAGYLYRYVMEYSKESPSSVYRKAPIKRIANRYLFYHTQDWDYVKMDLGIQ